MIPHFPSGSFRREGFPRHYLALFIYLFLQGRMCFCINPQLYLRASWHFDERGVDMFNVHVWERRLECVVVGAQHDPAVLHGGNGQRSFIRPQTVILRQGDVGISEENIFHDGNTSISNDGLTVAWQTVLSTNGESVAPSWIRSRVMLMVPW
ncbi:hypothetical protein MA12_gp09 [Pectobacterium phage MA12]|uniref:Uncharacterized protein n=1 Tax=Pectobacterium phage MA12 TaxID=2686474 RepID=A0A6B9RH31_9CAUD|nr:hypothetical protein JT357_gp09 [Pectobacterium phage MA12]QHI00836.1 hypothetical protein MA12_gp09 [Pectobacterium phage MA12]